MKTLPFFLIPALTGFRVEQRTNNEMANEIKSRMNFDVDPCDDFEEFVCGGIDPGEEAPWDAAQSKIYDIIEQNLAGQGQTGGIGKAQELYKVCMDTTQINRMSTRHLEQNVLPFLVFPTLKVGKSTTDVKLQLIAAWTKFGQNPIFSASYGLGQPSLAMPSSFYLTENAEDYKRYKHAYMEYIFKFGQKFRHQFGRKSNDRKTSDRTLRRMAYKIFNFELEMAKLISTPVELKNSYPYPTKILGDLPTNEIVQDWKNFFDTASTISGKSFSKSENSDITLSDEKWINSIDTAIQNANIEKHDLLDFIAWRVYMELVPYLGADWRNIAKEFNLEIFGKFGEATRSRECVILVSKQMPSAAGKIYHDKGFSTDAETAADEMFEKVRTAFSTNVLNDATWLTDGTKQRVKGKIDAITSSVGTSTYVSSYSSYQIDATDYLKTMINIAAEVVSLSFLRESLRDRNKYSASVNAYYLRSSNSMALFSGILQEPFYNSKMPAAMNFGGIGSVIGHEITHALDDTGSKYDEDGDLGTWWDPADRQRFNERVQCIRNEYSGFFDEDAGKNLDGNLTIGENIADNGAIWASYYAYQNWRQNNTETRVPGLSSVFTDEQLFYISYGQLWCREHGTKKSIQYTKKLIETDPHSPGLWRINGVVKNHTPFGSAFGCRKYQFWNPWNKPSPMSPKDTCRVW